MCHRFVSFDVENSYIESFLRLYFDDENHAILEFLRLLIVCGWMAVVHIRLLATEVVHGHMGLDLCKLNLPIKFHDTVKCNSNRSFPV